jgi:hypothetical protein
MQQEEKILGVRIIGVPAKIVELDVALADLVLKTVEIGRTHHQLHVDLGKLPGQPVETRLLAHAAAGGIEIDNQRLAGLGVATVRVAAVGQQFFGRLDRLAFAAGRPPNHKQR